MEERSTGPGSDATLVERARRGDAAAFDAIVRAHRREVYAVARRILGTHEDADEAAQETFLRAWRGLRRFRGEASLRTWLFRIAVNASRTLRARRGDAAALETVEPVVDSGPGADEGLRRAEAARRVRRAVAALPPRQREVVVLKVFSEMTYKDVAFVLGLSEGAVKAHLHQAVANLRRHFGHTG